MHNDSGITTEQESNKTMQGFKNAAISSKQQAAHMSKKKTQKQARHNRTRLAPHKRATGMGTMQKYKKLSIQPPCLERHKTTAFHKSIANDV